MAKLIEIEQGAAGKDGTLKIDGKEILFINDIDINIPVNGFTQISITRTLGQYERLNVMLKDVPVEIKTTCPYCKSEMIERDHEWPGLKPAAPPRPDPSDDPGVDSYWCMICKSYHPNSTPHVAKD